MVDVILGKRLEAARQNGRQVSELGLSTGHVGVSTNGGMLVWGIYLRDPILLGLYEAHLIFETYAEA